MKRESLRRRIEQSLLEQLAMMGVRQEHYVDLIRDYLGMWDIKRKLIKDIKDRGIVYEEISAAGKPVMKNNPSTKELVAVNKQMLSLLKELGLSTENAAGGDVGDDL